MRTAFVEDAHDGWALSLSFRQHGSSACSTFTIFSLILMAAVFSYSFTAFICLFFSSQFFADNHRTMIAAASSEARRFNFATKNKLSKIGAQTPNNRRWNNADDGSHASTKDFARIQTLSLFGWDSKQHRIHNVWSIECTVLCDICDANTLHFVQYFPFFSLVRLHIGKSDAEWNTNEATEAPRFNTFTFYTVYNLELRR